MSAPSRPNFPKHAKAHVSRILIGSVLGLQAISGILTPILLFSGHQRRAYEAFTVTLAIMLLGLAFLITRGRKLKRRLRETDCHLCPDCGYDLRDHTDATPCPECGRVWNQAADTEVWRTLYKGHLKY